jgi:hypothetical protein
MKRYIPYFQENLLSLLEQKLQEWVEDIKADRNDLLEELKVMYEWEYKYNQLKQNINIKNERKVENILKIIRVKLTPILKSISLKIEEVFKDWLKNHALTSPKIWATARVKELDDMGDSPNEILANAYSEYKRYNGNTDNFYENAFIASFKEFSDLIYDIKYDIVSAYEDDLENTEDEDQRKDIQQSIDYINDLGITENAKEALEFLETYVGEYADGFLSREITSEALIPIYEKVVFPVWFKHWKKEGIVQTRKIVNETYKDLKKSKTESDLSKKIMYINIALNASHQTGYMMDYVENKWGVSKQDLDRLSDVSDSDLQDWNKEIKMAII